MQVGAEHTPKNRLFTAIRRRGVPDEAGSAVAAATAQAQRAAAIAEYTALRDATGGCGIRLGALLGVD